MPGAAAQRPTELSVPVAERAGVAETGPDVYYAGGRRRPEITLAAPVPGPATVEVVDEDGSVVRRLTVEVEPGSHTVEWDGMTADGPARRGRYGLRPQGAPKASTSFTLVDHVFPIRGRHDLGRSATNGFGGGRGHMGQDMFAACGTPVVAARGGRVDEVAYNGAGGHHLVIRSRETGLDYVYMHLRSAPSVREGESVETRQRIGRVGRSGNADGCHLHFELWHAPGWYAGGRAFDPLPRLRRWDAGS